MNHTLGAPLRGVLSDFAATEDRLRKLGTFAIIGEQIGNFRAIQAQIERQNVFAAADQSRIRDAFDAAVKAHVGVVQAWGKSHDTAKRLAEMASIVPKLPEMAATLRIGAGLDDTWGERISTMLMTPVIPRPPLPYIEADDPYFFDPDDPLEALEAKNETLLAENQALMEENAALRRKITHLKQRLDIPAFKNLVEYTDPDVPPNESRFSTD